MAGARWSVRRFAAIDMYGTTGTLRRRRLVLAEFVLGTACFVVLGVVFTMHGGWFWGAWLLGCGLSYGALAVHAVGLYPSHRLEAELEGVDTPTEIRRYSAAQLLLFVPGLIAVVALAQALSRHPHGVTNVDGVEEDPHPG
ncbi:hypothetical protein [Streptomyces tropicalis]|uniref:Uncharacterized protein n=1 Tax=Streptomyces tropicalis TaxID=3034234 RepID=A0ABT6A693_9ACTN|nr:hypothetical protein [Streptomyces tropicalis]MDF3300165.1 hypothetical protein [Streptomyces tropicalis]